MFIWVEEFAANTWSVGLLFFALGLANVFFPPIPIETLALFGGYLVGTGHGHLPTFWLAILTGMTLGSMILYTLAVNAGDRLVSLPLVKRYISTAQLERARVWFSRYGIWTLYLGKLMPGMSLVTVLASGLFGLERRRAWTAIVLANAIYFGALLWLGHYLGQEWQMVIAIMGKYGMLLLVLAALALLTWLLVSRRRAHRG